MKSLNLRSWRGFLLLALLLFFFLYNFFIMQKERFLQQSDQVILSLAPVDPRSLMQGDYMILNFTVQEEIRAYFSNKKEPVPLAGIMVIIKADDGVYNFQRPYNGERLSDGERLLQYKTQGLRLKIAGGSFFFEEGLAPLYNQARFALLSVDKNGQAIITSLLDNKMHKLHKQRWDAEKRILLEN